MSYRQNDTARRTQTKPVMHVMSFHVQASTVAYMSYRHTCTVNQSVPQTTMVPQTYTDGIMYMKGCDYDSTAHGEELNSLKMHQGGCAMGCVPSAAATAVHPLLLSAPNGVHCLAAAAGADPAGRV